MAQPDANDVIARYNADIATLTQRAIFAESRADAAEVRAEQAEAALRLQGEPSEGSPTA